LDLDWIDQQSFLKVECCFIHVLNSSFVCSYFIVILFRLSVLPCENTPSIALSVVMEDDALADTHAPSSVPRLKRQQTREGFHRHTPTGVSYVEFLDKDIASERLGVMASLADIEKMHGAGNALYFYFLLFSVGANGLLFVLALVEWISYMRDPLRVLIRGPFEWKDFFVSEYLRPQQDRVWYVATHFEKPNSNSFSQVCVHDLRCLLVSCFPSALLHVGTGLVPEEKDLRSGNHTEKEDTVFDAHFSLFFSKIIVGQDDDELKKNMDFSRGTLIKWRVLVFIICCSALGIAAGILYGCAQAENALIQGFFFFLVSFFFPCLDIRVPFLFFPAAIRGQTSLNRANLATFTSLISSTALVILSLVWIPISRGLTRLEKHNSYLFLRISQAVKLLVFRIALLFLLFIFDSTVQIVQLSTTSCILLDHGTKILAITVAGIALFYKDLLFFPSFLIFVFSNGFQDIVLVNGLSLLWAAIAVRCRMRWRCCRSKEMNVEKPETMLAHFELSDELLQLAYRQFLCYIGFAVMPLISFVVLVGFVLEYFLSRLLMLKLSSPPKFIDDRLGLFYFVALLSVAVLAWIFYPIGPIFLALTPTSLPTSAVYRNCSVWNAVRRL
jgi:hypothetical protein